MISPEEFALLNQNAQRFYASQAKAAPKKKTGWRNSSPTAFLSEGGGMAGAGIGAAIGTGIMPVVGTAIGAGIGGLAGAFGGKLAEDKIRDDEWDFKDAGIEGAISGVMGASPLRAAKGAFGAAKAGVKGGTLDDAIMAASDKYAGKGITSKVGDQLAKTSDDFRVRQFRLNKTQLTDFDGKHGEDAIETLKRYKITKPEDIETNALQPLMASFDEAVEVIGQVPKKDILAAMKEQADTLIKSAVTDEKALGRQLRAEAASINKTYGALMPATEANALRKRFDALVNYTNKAANPARYDINKRTADAIRNTLQDRADALNLKNVQGLSLREIGRELSKAIQLNDAVKAQANLGRGNQTVRLTDTMGAAAFGAGGGASALAGAGAIHALNSPTGTRALANITGGLGKANQVVGGGLDRFGLTPAGAATRVGATGAAVGAMNGMSQPSSLEDAMMGAQDGASDPYGQTAGYAPQSPTGGSSMAQGGMPAETTPYTKERLIADIKRDPTNASDYIGLYKELSEIFTPPEAKQKPLSAEASKVIANANSGLNSLQQLNQIISTEGVPKATILPGRGMLGNAPANALGTAEYDTAAKNITDVITRLRTGAALTDSEEKFYKSQIPQAFDSPQVIQQKLQIFADLFESVASRTGSAGNSLEDMMMSMQSQQ